jgi:hypothetical protein
MFDTRVRGSAHLAVTASLLVIALVAAIFFGLRAIPAPAQDQHSKQTHVETIESGAHFDAALKVIEVAVFGCGLFSIILLAEQIRVTEHRAKRVAYHTYFATLPKQVNRLAFEGLIQAQAFDAQFEQGKPLGDAAVKSISSDLTRARSLRGYLDDFEEFCAAVNCGVLDEPYAFGLEGSRVVRTYEVFMPFIVKCRETNPLLPTAYRHIETLGEKWRKKKEKQLAKVQRSIAKANK